MKDIYIILFIMASLFMGCNNHNHESENNSHDEMVKEHNDQSVIGLPENDHEREFHEDHKHNDDALEITEIKTQPFFEIIRTSGQIILAQGDEVTLSSAHEGVVVFNEKQLFSGKKVIKGEILLTVSGKELLHDNIEASYKEAIIAYEKAKSNYDRSVELNKDKIISDKELLDTKQEFEKTKNKYEIIKRNYSSGGQKLTADINGFIKDVFVSEGQFVNTGQSLIKLTKNKRLVIKADVPQRYYHMMENIKSANFITNYDMKWYDIDDLNGKLISYGKTSGENSLFTPVFFEIDNKGSLMAGSYIEVFLKTTELPDCLVIPKTAVLEESGRYYVYVEGHDAEFEKHYIKIDCSDGKNYHIVEGISEGDRVVAKNPYQVKLSLMSSALPTHGHNH